MKCLICQEPASHNVDGIALCGFCNLTLQSGNSDTLMQTLGVLHRLAKAEAELQRIVGSGDKLIAAIEAMPPSVIYNSYEAQKVMRFDCATEAAIVFAKIVGRS